MKFKMNNREWEIKELSQEEIKYLQEPYIPHKVVGAIDKGGIERIERK